MKVKYVFYYLTICLLMMFYISIPVYATEIPQYKFANSLLSNDLQRLNKKELNKNLKYSEENLLKNPSLRINTDEDMCGEIIGDQEVECSGDYRFFMISDWFVNSIDEENNDVNYNENPFCEGDFNGRYWSNRVLNVWAYCVQGNDGKIFFHDKESSIRPPSIRNADYGNDSKPAFIQFIDGEDLDNGSEEDYFNILGSAVYSGGWRDFTDNFLVILQDTEGNRVEFEIPAHPLDDNYSGNQHNDHAIYHAKTHDFYATIPKEETEELDLEDGIYFIVQSQNPQRYFYLNYDLNDESEDEKSIILTKGEAITKIDIVYDEDGIIAHLGDELTEEDIYDSLEKIIVLSDAEVEEFHNDFSEVVDINSFEILDNPDGYNDVVISARSEQQVAVEFEMDGSLETVNIPLSVNSEDTLFFKTKNADNGDSGFSIGILERDDQYKLVGSLGDSHDVQNDIMLAPEIYGLAILEPEEIENEDGFDIDQMNIDINKLNFDSVDEQEDSLAFRFPEKAKFSNKDVMEILDDFEQNILAEESIQIGEVIRVAMTDYYYSNNKRYSANFKLDSDQYEFNAADIDIYRPDDAEGYKYEGFNYFFLINDNHNMQPLYNNLVDVQEDYLELGAITDLEKINQCRVTYDEDDEEFRYVFVDEDDDEIEDELSQEICGNILDFSVDDEFYHSIEYSFDLLEYEKDTYDEYIAEILVTSVFDTSLEENEQITMTFTVKRDFIRIEEDDTVSWLPDYEKWSSFNETIPKETTFVMTPAMAEPIAASEDINIKSDKETVTFGKRDMLKPNEPSWVRWTNVGYYKGKKIDLKLTLQSQSMVYLTEKDNQYNTITLKGSNAFSFSVTSAIEKEGMNVTYEFLDQQGNKVPVSGYWPISDIYNDQMISIPTKEIKKIYSLSRGNASEEDTTCTDCTLLSYSLDGSNIRIIGQSERSLKPEQQALVFTYENETSIDYMLFSNESTPRQKIDVKYAPSDIYMRVAIPDVIDDSQIISEVSSKQQFTNQFIQYIPFEPKNKRDQHMNWKVMLPENSIFDVPIQKIHIFDESGIQQQDLFDITLQNQEITIKPKSLDNDSLYNHYYWFKIPLTFNGTEVKEQDLDQKWLNYKSTVQLFINNQLQNQVMSGTKINMQANVDYQYKDQNGDVFHSENKHTLITHKIPKVEEQRPGYRYINSEPNDYQDKIILESKSQVQLNYKLLKQGLIVPDTLEFETISLPITRPGTRSRLNANWQLTVYGDYSQTNRPNVYVVQQQPFISENHSLEDTVYMTYQDKRIPLKHAQQSLSIDSSDFICSGEECNTHWDLNQGILLKYDDHLSSQSTFKEEVYTSSMIFSLQNAL